MQKALQVRVPEMWGLPLRRQEERLLFQVSSPLGRSWMDRLVVGQHFNVGSYVVTFGVTLGTCDNNDCQIVYEYTWCMI